MLPPNSSVNGSLNALSAVIAYDYLTNWMPRMSDKALLNFSKGTTVLLGGIGYGFIYFADVDSAFKAKDACAGMKLDGRFIRVDFSLTHRPHAIQDNNDQFQKKQPREFSNENGHNDQNDQNDKNNDLHSQSNSISGNRSRSRNQSNNQRDNPTHNHSRHHARHHNPNTHSRSASRHSH